MKSLRLVVFKLFFLWHQIQTPGFEGCHTPYLLSNCALHFSHSSFFINSLRMYIRYYCSRGRKRVPLRPVPPISKQNEKRQYVHPTEFDVQYRATDTENSNPNIMISGSSRTKRPASHTSLSTCVLSM